MDSSIITFTRAIILKATDLKSIGITTPVYINDTSFFITKSCDPNVESYGQISLFLATGYQMAL